ncbi:TetR family transcriptional regulator [Actinopolymorpha rutila]
MTMSEQALNSRRPKRADARRNYDKVLGAARAAFAEQGTNASLEEIARRAGVGIGTLYRHFGTRQDLLEAVYLDEVEALCQSAEDFADLPPWEALVSWLNRFVSYVSTKRALAEELAATVGMETEVFKKCHDAIFSAGEPLLERAQAARAVRSDAAFGDVIRLVSGVTMIKGAKPEDIERILAMALDGLRYTPPA